MDDQIGSNDFEDQDKEIFDSENDSDENFLSDVNSELEEEEEEDDDFNLNKKIINEKKRFLKDANTNDEEEINNKELENISESFLDENSEYEDDKEDDKDDDKEDDIEDNEDNEDEDEDETDKEKKANANLIRAVKAYKEQNIQEFSPLGMIGLLCKVTQYIKQGNRCIDSRFDFNYPDTTEESYAIETILTGKHPFIFVPNGHLIKIPTKNIVNVMKYVLRPVESNTKIFFTKDFTERFPVFRKTLHDDDNYSLEISVNECNERKKS